MSTSVMWSASRGSESNERSKHLAHVAQLIAAYLIISLQDGSIPWCRCPAAKLLDAARNNLWTPGEDIQSIYSKTDKMERNSAIHPSSFATLFANVLSLTFA
eukprot:scaffold1_cov375-Pavlova_lutheri.AAC.33